MQASSSTQTLPTESAPFSSSPSHISKPICPVFAALLTNCQWKSLYSRLWSSFRSIHPRSIPASALLYNIRTPQTAVPLHFHPTPLPRTGPVSGRPLSQYSASLLWQQPCPLQPGGFRLCIQHTFEHAAKASAGTRRTSEPSRSFWGPASYGLTSYTTEEEGRGPQEEVGNIWLIVCIICDTHNVLCLGFFAVLMLQWSDRAKKPRHADTTGTVSCEL